MMRITLMMMSIVCLTSQSGQVTKQTHLKNRPPVIEKFESSPALLEFCGPTADPATEDRIFCATNKRNAVTLSVTASDPDGDKLKYEYSASAGEILGEGSTVTWKPANKLFGYHTITVRVRDANGAEATAVTKINVIGCSSCVFSDPPCPMIGIKGDEILHNADKTYYELDISPGYFESRPDYLWSVTGGTIIRGQHTPRIRVEVTGDIGSNITAAVEVSGLDRACEVKASRTTPIKP